jgi:phage terminase large subunit GpA-like protein
VIQANVKPSLTPPRGNREPKIGERPDADLIEERKELFAAAVPDRVVYLTAGIDSQLDRYEMRVWGWGPGEESWLVDRQIIMGRHDDEQTLKRVDEAINKTYKRRNGAEMSISRICWDIGGLTPQSFMAVRKSMVFSA